MAEDRAELNDLAEAEPERLRAMIETWTDMTENVLHASPKFYAPVSRSQTATSSSRVDATLTARSLRRGRSNAKAKQRSGLARTLN